MLNIKQTYNINSFISVYTIEKYYFIKQKFKSFCVRSKSSNFKIFILRIGLFYLSSKC